jgi:hypothetical protein
MVEPFEEHENDVNHMPQGVAFAFFIQKRKGEMEKNILLHFVNADLKCFLL